MTDAARKDRPTAPKYTPAELEDKEPFGLKLIYADVFGWGRRCEALNMSKRDLISSILGGEEQ